MPVRYSDLTIFRYAGEIFRFDNLQIACRPVEPVEPVDLLSLCSLCSLSTCAACAALVLQAVRLLLVQVPIFGYADLQMCRSSDLTIFRYADLIA